MAVVLLTIALNIRAGAYLLLPALLLMAFIFRHQLPRHTFTLILVGILIGFAFNILVAGIYSQNGMCFTAWSPTATTGTNSRATILKSTVPTPPPKPG